jgi:hypothetical protein
MTYRATMAILIWGTALAPAFAEDAGALTLGIGMQSCAYWQSSPGRQAEGTVWIYGFWTAANHANEQNHKVGRYTDTAGKIAEVKKTCDARPSMLLVDAVAETYSEMATRDAKKP